MPDVRDQVTLRAQIEALLEKCTYVPLGSDRFNRDDSIRTDGRITALRDVLTLLDAEPEQGWQDRVCKHCGRSIGEWNANHSGECPDKNISRPSSPAAEDGCEIVRVSSRVCERGTHCCVIHHGSESVCSRCGKPYLTEKGIHADGYVMCHTRVNIEKLKTELLPSSPAAEEK